MADKDYISDVLSIALRTAFAPLGMGVSDVLVDTITKTIIEKHRTEKEKDEKDVLNTLDITSQNLQDSKYIIDDALQTLDQKKGSVSQKEDSEDANQSITYAFQSLEEAKQEIENAQKEVDKQRTILKELQEKIDKNQGSIIIEKEALNDTITQALMEYDSKNKFATLLTNLVFTVLGAILGLILGKVF